MRGRCAGDLRGGRDLTCEMRCMHTSPASPNGPGDAARADQPASSIQPDERRPSLASARRHPPSAAPRVRSSAWRMRAARRRMAAHTREVDTEGSECRCACGAQLALVPRSISRRVPRSRSPTDSCQVSPTRDPWEARTRASWRRVASRWVSALLRQRMNIAARYVDPKWTCGGARSDDV